MPVSCAAARPARSFLVRCLPVALLSTAAGLLLGATSPAAQPPADRPALAPDTTAGHLRGRVFDAYTQEPLPFASLWLSRLGLGTLSDEQGYFAFELTTAQLDSVPVDTLTAVSLAFQRQRRLVQVRQFPSDSALVLTLARDPTVRIGPGLIVQTPRRRNQSGRAATASTSGAASAPPRRTFWQRLFGGKQ